MAQAVGEWVVDMEADMNTVIVYVDGDDITLYETHEEAMGQLEAYDIQNNPVPMYSGNGGRVVGHALKPDDIWRSGIEFEIQSPTEESKQELARLLTIWADKYGSSHNFSSENISDGIREFSSQLKNLAEAQSDNGLLRYLSKRIIIPLLIVVFLLIASFIGLSIF